MIEAIESYLAGINHELAVFLVAMIPIIELRGAIPFGVGLGMEWHTAYILSVLGNIIPVPFVILFFRPIIEYLEKTKIFGSLASKLKQRTKSKAGGMKKKSKILSLYIFVALPIPGTGAWTGSAIAAIMKMRLKEAIPAIIAGVLSAGVLMTVVSKLGEWLFGLF